MVAELFGTDGIRGRVGKEPITPSFAHHLGCVLADFFGRDSKVFIGRDTRESSHTLELNLAQGLASGGVQVASLGVLPTPGISYCTRHGEATFGIAITASHNPYDYNGFKLFSKDGLKFDLEIEKRLERALSETTRELCQDSATLVSIDTEARGRYLNSLHELASQFDLLDLPVVIDCAHGATTQVAIEIFSQIFKNPQYIGSAPDGLNINQGVGSTAISGLQQVVRRTNAELGIAFDGDGDRVLFVDAQGELVDGDHVLFILAKRHLLQERNNSGVVGTVMSNHGVQIALDVIDVPFVRTAVGDKNVHDELLRRDWLLGGEPSGHVIWRECGETGDGIKVALAVLEAMQHDGVGLHELASQISMFPQALRSIQAANPHALVTNQSVEEITSRFSDQMGLEGRLLVRASGTEPIVRVMVEPTVEVANRIADALVDAIRALN